MEYENIAVAPQGLSYLSGDIMPWDDYVIMRIDDDTSIACWGQADYISNDYVHFDKATYRQVVRNTGTGYNTIYNTYESVASDVGLLIDYPYYAYGNVIGVSYDLPSSNNIASCFVVAAVIVSVVLSVFRTLWSLKRCVEK